MQINQQEKKNSEKSNENRIEKMKMEKKTQSNF